MKRIIFAFILLLALMAAFVVMWGQINKVLMDLDGSPRKSRSSATGCSDHTA